MSSWCQCSRGANFALSAPVLVPTATRCCCMQASVYFCDSSDPSFNQEASASGQCLYRISYAEQSSSEGKLVRDVFTFPNQRTRVPVAFGCEDGETGEIYKQRPDGILGMGNSPGAFHSQVGFRVFCPTANWL